MLGLWPGQAGKGVGDLEEAPRGAQLCHWKGDRDIVKCYWLMDDLPTEFPGPGGGCGTSFASFGGERQAAGCSELHVLP